MRLSEKLGFETSYAGKILTFGSQSRTCLSEQVLRFCVVYLMVSKCYIFQSRYLQQNYLVIKAVVQVFPLHLHVVSFTLLFSAFILSGQKLQAVGEGQMAPVRSRKQARSGRQDLPFHPQVAAEVTESLPFVLFVHTDLYYWSVF